MATHIDTLPHVPSQPSRRAMLGGLAVAAVAAVPAIAEGADPVLALVARAEVLKAQADALAALGDAGGADHFWDQEWMANDQVLTTPPTTWAGVVAQLRVLANRLDEGEEGDLLRLADFAQALAGRAVA